MVKHGIKEELSLARARIARAAAGQELLGESILESHLAAGKVQDLPLCRGVVGEDTGKRDAVDGVASRGGAAVAAVAQKLPVVRLQKKKKPGKCGQ